MAVELFSTGIATTKTDINDSVTTITLSAGMGALFTAPTGGDYELVTLESATAKEIVKITARTGDVLTVVRAQGGTLKAAWLALTKIYGHVTIREQIINAFAVQAQKLSTVPVLRAQRSAVESSARFVSVWDGGDNLIGNIYNAQRLGFPLAVECIVKTINHSIEINDIMGAMIVNFMDHGFTGKWLTVELATATPIYPQDGGNLSAINVTFDVTYETVRGDPYVQC